MTAALLSFDGLVTAIGDVDTELARQASRAINMRLTQRNWVMGCYIAEYEQRGVDRANYGEQVLLRLSEQLRQRDVNCSEARDLRRYRQFYLTYPQLRTALEPGLEWPMRLPAGADDSSARGTNAVGLLAKLSFSHFVELMQCDEPAKRAFYEAECMKRQIASLYYERAGPSTDPSALSVHAQAKAERASVAQTHRNASPTQAPTEFSPRHVDLGRAGSSPLQNHCERAHANDHDPCPDRRRDLDLHRCLRRPQQEDDDVSIHRASPVDRLPAGA